MKFSYDVDSGLPRMKCKCGTVAYGEEGIGVCGLCGSGYYRVERRFGSGRFEGELPETENYFIGAIIWNAQGGWENREDGWHKIDIRDGARCGKNGRFVLKNGIECDEDRLFINMPNKEMWIRDMKPGDFGFVSPLGIFGWTGKTWLRGNYVVWSLPTKGCNIFVERKQDGKFAAKLTEPLKIEFGILNERDVTIEEFLS